MTRGWQLYLDSVKSSAGSRKIEVVSEDEGSNDPKVALEKARKLFQQDKADFLAGIVSSDTALAIKDAALEAKAITIIAHAGANAITRKGHSPYLFRTSYASHQVAIVGKWYYDNVGQRVVLLGSDSADGHEIINAFKGAYTKAGGAVTKEIYAPLNSDDFGPYVAEIQLSRTPALFTFLLGADAVRFLRVFQRSGLKGGVRVTGTFLTTDDIMPAQTNTAVGVKDISYYASALRNPTNDRFVADYNAKFGSNPSLFSVRGYDAAHLLVEAINKVDGDVSDKDALVKAMESTKFDSPRGPFAIDAASHNVIQHWYAMDVKQDIGQLTKVISADIGESSGSEPA